MVEGGGAASLCHYALLLSMSRPAAAERGSECRLHVLEAGWQKRHGGVPGSTQERENGVTRRGGARKRGGGGGKGRRTGECVRDPPQWSAESGAFCACCSSAHTRVLATVSAFACMSMLMSTHSRGQTLTHK